MKRIEVTKLEFIKIEPRGRAVSNKFWVKHDNKMKLVKLSANGNDQDVMEFLSSIILNKIGINCVDVQLCYDSYSKEKGCLVTSFLTDEADVSYDTFGWNIVSKKDSNDELKACFDQVHNIYSKLYKINKEQLNDLFREYIRVIFGKCILENFDSKLENIGLVYNEKADSYRIPPSYDNGIAFKSFNSFSPTFCCIGSENQIFKIESVMEYILNNYFDFVYDTFIKLESLSEEIEEILNSLTGINYEKKEYIVIYLKKIYDNIKLNIENRRKL